MSDLLVKELNQLSISKPVSKNKERRKFKFSEPHFDARKFYKKYQNADFFHNSENVYNVFAKYDELKNVVMSCDEFEMSEMLLEPGVPLVIKKSKFLDERDINQDDFTLNRLTGFLAAYVCNNAKNFRGIFCVESEKLKIVKPSFGLSSPMYFKEYLSAVSGAEYFIKEFDYFPFLSALHRYYLKQISEEKLNVIANIRDPDSQEPLAAICGRNYDNIIERQSNFGMKFETVLAAAPKNIKQFFKT